MIEQAFLDLPQYNVYTNSLTPLVHYFKEHKNSIPTEDEINKLIPYAKQTDFILTTFHEIIDDLNYDKEKLSLAHKKHAYQRLTQSGWSHYKVTNYSIGLNMILFFIVYFVSNIFVAFILALIVLALSMKFVDNKKAFE